MYIPQAQLANLRSLVSPQKVVVIYGPRRCGKTTLVRKYLETIHEPFLFVTGDDPAVRPYFTEPSVDALRRYIGSHRLLVIDEAQTLPEIGQTLKLIVDHIDGMRVIATGSSSFDLARMVGEPLTGRKWTLHLYPLAQTEIIQTEAPHQTSANLEARLLYGAYPEVVTHADDDFRKRYLGELVSSYLYKDILELDGVRQARKLSNLLELVALQIGHEVSLTELGTQLDMGKNTVERYLDLLERAFVVFRVRGFSRNARKEVTKSNKWYFYDTGVRNALINNFNPLSLRQDAGDLWENYCVSERIKWQSYGNIASHNHFWRTYDQQEIDWVEERDGALHGYEMKWGTNSRNRPPKSWSSLYPDASYTIINPLTYLQFIGVA